MGQLLSQLGHRGFWRRNWDNWDIGRSKKIGCPNWDNWDIRLRIGTPNRNLTMSVIIPGISNRDTRLEIKKFPPAAANTNHVTRKVFRPVLKFESKTENQVV